VEGQPAHYPPLCSKMIFRYGTTFKSQMGNTHTPLVFKNYTKTRVRNPPNKKTVILFMNSILMNEKKMGK
jgi:hypothetical protein